MIQEGQSACDRDQLVGQSTEQTNSDFALPCLSLRASSVIDLFDNLTWQLREREGERETRGVLQPSLLRPPILVVCPRLLWQRVCQFIPADSCEIKRLVVYLFLYPWLILLRRR